MASLTKELWQEHLLAAIDLIKGKRARPDVPRITEQVLKTLGPSSSFAAGGLTEAQFKKRVPIELEQAVNEGEVIKVRYKEGTSYRNPEMVNKGKEKVIQTSTATTAKDDQQEQQGNGKGTAVATQGSKDDLNGTIDLKDDYYGQDTTMDTQDTSSSTTEHDVNAAGTDSNNGDGPHSTCTPPNPSPPELTVFNTTPVLEEPMAPILKPPVLRLGPPILKMGTNSPQQPPLSVSANHQPNAPMDSSRSSSGGPDDSSSNRRGQRKRIKKSLGSDFLDPSQLGYGFLKTAFDPKCSACNEVGPRKDDLMNCSKCSYCAHQKCLQTGEKMLSLVSGEKKWLCMDCRPKCSTCELNKSDPHNPLMTCVDCDTCYHVNCLDFTLDTDASNWKCFDCIDNELEKEAEKLGLESLEVQSSRNGQHISYHYGQNGQSARMVVSHGNQRKRSHSSSRSSDVGVSLLMSSIAKSRIVPGTIKEDSLDMSSSMNNNQETASCGASSAEVEMSVDSNLVTENGGEDKDKENQASSVTSPSASATSASGTYRTKVPSDWSVGDVSDFLDFVGFSPESSVFRDQEIDGKSLLLLKRDDVINGLSLKLGPALKIYSLINHLQHR